MSTTFSHRRAVVLIANFVAATCALSFSASAWAEPVFKQPDPRETRRVQAYLDSKDCQGAARAARDGVKARQPDVLLMAGMMMEEGHCMKADWEKAVTLYDMAYQAGSPTARSALIAALAVAGRDNARALWYAAQQPKNLPSYCFPQADPLKDPDAFNAELERMAPNVFKACVYMVGVTHEIVGHTKFPSWALYHNLQGKLTMKFVPSSGTISWTFEKTADRMAGSRDMGQAQFDDERKIEKILLNYLTAKGDFALARYTRPEGIDPAIVLPATFEFAITD
jgi:hypothetical protein